jgi:hypothetical protein
MKERHTPPWWQSPPKKAKRTKLTPASKAKARAMAGEAGRPYPNLVDNMRAAKEQRRGKKP